MMKFIHFFNMYSLNTFSGPETILGARNIEEGGGYVLNITELLVEGD